MNSDKILFVDTETGGIDPTKNSLLSMAFVVWQNFKIIDKIEILINDGVLNATSEALRVNKIDLEQHKKIALPPHLAIKCMDDFLNKHFSPNEKITLAGHNINFDIGFLKFFLTKYNYDFGKKFSHRYIDTFPLLYYLYLSGKLKEKTFSSQEAFDHFGIKVDKRHSALGDVIATAMLFSALIKKLSHAESAKRFKQESL